MDKVTEKILEAHEYFERNYPELGCRKVTFIELTTLAAEYAEYKLTQDILPKN